MSGVTERELRGIREAQEMYMPQRVVIRRRQFSGDSEFEPVNIAVDVPCRFTPGFGFWRAVADRYQGVTPYRATVPYDQDVKAGDTLVDEESRVFEVRDVLAPESYQTAKQVLTDLVTDG